MDPRIGKALEQSKVARWLLDREADPQRLAEYSSHAIDRMKAEEVQRGRRGQSGRRQGQSYAKRLRAAGEEAFSRFFNESEFYWGPADPKRVRLETDVAVYARTSSRLAEAAEQGKIRTENRPHAEAVASRRVLLMYVHEIAGEWAWKPVLELLEDCANAVDLDLEAIRFTAEGFKQETYRFRREQLRLDRANEAAEEEIRQLSRQIVQTRKRPEPEKSLPPDSARVTKRRPKKTLACH